MKQENDIEIASPSSPTSHIRSQRQLTPEQLEMIQKKRENALKRLQQYRIKLVTTLTSTSYFIAKEHKQHIASPPHEPDYDSSNNHNTTNQIVPFNSNHNIKKEACTNTDDTNHNKQRLVRNGNVIIQRKNANANANTSQPRSIENKRSKLPSSSNHISITNEM